MIYRRLSGFALFLSMSFTAFSQSTPTANYALAARFSPTKVNKMLFSTSVDPHWLKLSDRFWYVYENRDGKNWYIVDAAKNSKRQLFDPVKLAAEITRIVRDPFDGQHLPITNLKFTADENSIRFEILSTLDEEKKDTSKTQAGAAAGRGGRGGAAGRPGAPAPGGKSKKTFFFEYNLNTGVLTEMKDYEKPKTPATWASFSPDKKFVFFSRKNNLYYMDSANYSKALIKEDDSTIVEFPLTKDGVEDYSYGGGGFGNETNVDKEKNKDKRKNVGLLWSKDGRYFTLTRTDNRLVKDLWVINNVAEPRPTLETYKYQMPGEKEAPQRELYLFDFQNKTNKKIKIAAFKDQEMAVWSAPPLQKERDDERRASFWQGTNDKFYLSRTSRDLKRIDLCVVDINSDSARAIVAERLNTYVESRRVGLINGGKELIQWSEADGWAHFYLYDENGKLKNQITSGAFHCEDIEGIDEKNRVLYFTANGREPNEDPYYLHLYRVNFDGTGLKLLNPGNFDNTGNVDDNNRYFVNTSSRVNTAPVSVLQDVTGKVMMTLETTDMSGLFEAGYKFPEPFKVKAADGYTDLYGVMYKPFDFDSTKKYPIIEYVYPGPQTEAVNKAFGKGMDRIDRLAQMGFIVITVGNRGGHPSRSKWYHNFGYGNLRDYGLADKKAAIEQLSYRYKYIDVEKVGIQGHSGGGFMSTAAMLVYPDFFKVAVSSAGNHENNIYNRWWSEKHHGVREQVSDKGDTSFVYAVERNPELAKNLKGHLMLSHGDIDNNVHPANSIRMVNALIKANKRFELVLLPGQRHGYGTMTEYFFWRQCDFFAQHLLGAVPNSVNIEEMDRELELGGEKRAGAAAPDEE
ncbi:DPP IV N-terminal domain-containing protein [Terrimonas sp. NA20]|uniref:DPP IV N-terminal domain-containing protein n=1 Tax=Terrimonas ginsenosidimutans TaxID=2908004 RepID=A0ABS9KW73_9BACT|nr:DPP IV N-terminal domain-containing protein [Terrimonas ginsenosidimutans]MCG2616555.1 DPP IV N-terminal domain-containing protein [Terrimonas ginsenosidimutans]